jgi:2-polyprenyl-6-methoxyphenol hydroxylase-like FAD-dependent oxidoreductase
MTNKSYDIITVGGGLGGAALAKVMTEHGARVLVVEREKRFKDRIRGEFFAPWGVAETQALGLYDLLRTTCALEAPRFGLYTEPEFGEPRDLRATTARQLPFFTFHHPKMQEVVLQAAVDAGAEVRRGASVRDVQLGGVPTVTVEQDGRAEEIRARLIVGADGRGSVVRKWADFSPTKTQSDWSFQACYLRRCLLPKRGPSITSSTRPLAKVSPWLPSAVGECERTWCRPKRRAYACKAQPIFPAS